MGGIHACMVAAFSRVPVACAAMLPPRSAAAAYSDGALSEFVHFAALRGARDSTGAAVLPTVLGMLRTQPPYPNSPLLLQLRSTPGDPARRAAAAPRLAAEESRGALARDASSAACGPSTQHASGARASRTGAAEGGGVEGLAGTGGINAMTGLHTCTTQGTVGGKTVVDMFEENGDLLPAAQGGSVCSGAEELPAASFLPPLATPRSALLLLDPTDMRVRQSRRPFCVQSAPAPARAAVCMLCMRESCALPMAS